ncbi:hypothetical protein KPH14_006273 [Odynerus spinipes]|uniref:Uncharacterized protein n=1 Tax=Odynerus spinipes TaxID=1348599 RepID=A0AAD9RCF0_9HYME|nr:hypothetical protein KPH14_006273 [Odynerus spinipes]
MCAVYIINRCPTTVLENSVSVESCYRLWDLEENKLVTNIDAIFDETKTAKAFVKVPDFYQTNDIEEDRRKWI